MVEKEPRYWIGTHSDLGDHGLIVTTGDANENGDWPVLFHSDYYPGLTEAFVTSGIIQARAARGEGTGMMFGEDSSLAKGIQEEEHGT